MAANTNRIAGLCYLTIDGKTYLLRGNFEYRPSTVTRETLTGLDRVHGYKEVPMAGMIKGQLSDGHELKIGDFNAGMTDVTVTAELANGKTVIGRNMWTVDTQSAKADDGTFEVTWEGPEVTEF